MAEDARKIFSRSFYLSEQQILSLYVHLGNPKALLIQLRLCFPGIYDVMWEAHCSMDKISRLGDVNSEFLPLILHNTYLMSEMYTTC